MSKQEMYAHKTWHIHEKMSLYICKVFGHTYQHVNCLSKNTPNSLFFDKKINELHLTNYMPDGFSFLYVPGFSENSWQASKHTQKNMAYMPSCVGFFILYFHAGKYAKILVYIP